MIIGVTLDIFIDAFLTTEHLRTDWDRASLTALFNHLEELEMGEFEKEMVLKPALIKEIDINYSLFDSVQMFLDEYVFNDTPKFERWIVEDFPAYEEQYGKITSRSDLIKFFAHGYGGRFHFIKLPKDKRFIIQLHLD